MQGAGVAAPEQFDPDAAGARRDAQHQHGFWAHLRQRGSQRRQAAADPTWMNNLTRAVMNVKLPVRSVLAEQRVPLAQLMALQPGDIIPISFGPEIPLLVANQRFARGAVGASNGRAALRLNCIEPIEDEDSQ